MSGSNEVRARFADAEKILPIGNTDPRTPCDAACPDDDIDPEMQAAMDCAKFPLNDYGNGKRFTRYFGDDLLFVPRVGWFVWDQKVWGQDDDKLEVRRAAQRVAAKISAECQYIALEDWENDLIALGQGAADAAKAIRKKSVANRSDAETASLPDLDAQIEVGAALKKKLAGLQRSHHSHAKNAGNTGPIGNLMIEAQVDVYRPLDALNVDPLMVNTETGVLRFVEDEGAPNRAFRVEVLPHARDLYLSKMMPVAYDPSATCPIFEEFLETVLPEPELRDFIRRWFGYSLTGLTAEQALAFFYGGGRNGKSTLVDQIARMMGAYATTVPIESLTGSDARKGADATPDLVRLPGARMVRASEPEKGQKMKEAIIKSLTGGEAILVRKMQQEFVEVVPEFKLTISGNHKPEIRGTDDGIWRRVMLIPFNVQIAADDVDKLLPQKLWAERSGILNWLIAGALDWLAQGLNPPEIVLDATKAYREESDPIMVFLNEACIVDGSDPPQFTKAKDLNAAFNAWLEMRGLDPWGNRTISNHFKLKAGSDATPGLYKSPSGHGYKHGKRSDTGWVGLGLSPAFLAQMEAEKALGSYRPSPPEPSPARDHPPIDAYADDF